MDSPLSDKTNKVTALFSPTKPASLENPEPVGPPAAPAGAPHQPPALRALVSAVDSGTDELEADDGAAPSAAEEDVANGEQQQQPTTAAEEEDVGAAAPEAEEHADEAEEADEEKPDDGAAPSTEYYDNFIDPEDLVEAHQGMLASQRRAADPQTSFNDVKALASDSFAMLSLADHVRNHELRPAIKVRSLSTPPLGRACLLLVSWFLLVVSL